MALFAGAFSILSVVPALTESADIAGTADLELQIAAKGVKEDAVT
ncbi:MAG: hypothetical protein RIB57_09005 [Pelagibacterium sp.]